MTRTRPAGGLVRAALHSLGPDGVLRRVNETWLCWLGYEREEVEGKLRFSDLLTTESLRTFHEELPRFVARGRVDDVELTMRRKAGTGFTVLLSATSVYDAAGTIVPSSSADSSTTCCRMDLRRRLATCGAER